MSTTYTSTANIDLADGPRAVLMADGDLEEHLLVSAFAARWAPSLTFNFAQDGGDLLLQLAAISNEEELPRALVLNYHMRRRNGFQILCELQLHPVLWQIPVIVLADTFRPDEEAAAYRAGAQWFQQKPQTVGEMHDLMLRVDELSARPFFDQFWGSIELSRFNAEFSAAIEEILSPTNSKSEEL